MNEVWEERYALEPKGMRAGWMNLLGHPVFPRDLALPYPGGKKLNRYQQTVNSTRDYLRMVEQHAPRGDLWAGWSPTTQYGLPGMERVFGDIDSPDLQDALVRARRYEEWCMADFGVQPACIFTAGKGFHLHLTHDFVEGVGVVYSDAFSALIQGSGASPDVGPLKHRKTYPRVPYSLNIKATGIHRRPMYVVPVDLTWDLDEILQASADINVHPYQIPHSDVLAGMLRPEVEAAQKRLERLQKRPIDVQTGMFEDLVQAAIAFSESVGWRLVNQAGKIDGRRRLLSTLYVPALMREMEGDRERVLGAVQAWVQASGANWMDYKRFAEGTIKDCVQKDGTLRSPMGLKRFWMEHPELKVDRSRQTAITFRKQLA